MSLCRYVHDATSNQTAFESKVMIPLLTRSRSPLTPFKEQFFFNLRWLVNAGMAEVLIVLPQNQISGIHITYYIQLFLSIEILV